MSKGNSAIKVLRTALKRVQKGWTQHVWSYRDSEGNVYVCLEGALFGYCNANAHGLTEPQKQARNVVSEIIREKTGRAYISIPEYNDAEDRTQEEIEEVVKLAIIRMETGGDIPDEYDGELSEEEFDELLAYLDAGKE